MATLQPVDFDPFAGETPRTEGVARVYIGQGAEKADSGPKLVPVDFDPFAKTFMDTAKGLGKAADAGVARAVAGIGGIVGDATDFVATRIGKVVNAGERYMGMPESPLPDRSKTFMSVIPTSAQMRDAIQRYFYNGEPEYQPQNKAEEHARTVGEFATGGLGGQGRKLVQRTGQVLLPAATSETAGQVTKGTAVEPYARFGGALVGGGAAALLNRPGTTAASIRAQLPEGVTPQMVDQAEALIARAGQQGIDLAWPEALSQVAGRPVMTNMLRHLEASPQTEARMAGFFGNRPRQVEGAARQQFDNIALPNATPSTIGPAVSGAARDTANDVRGIINKASDPFYKRAEGVLLTPAEMAQLQRIPGYKQARDAVRNDPQLNSYVSHLPDNSVGFLNELKKQFDQQGANAASKFNPAANQQIAAANTKAAEAVKQIGIAKSVDYEVALKVQQDTRERFLQPLLDGPLGKLAKKDVTTQKAIDTLFPMKPLANSEQEIGTAVSALAKRNPKAATDLVRAHVEGVFNSAAKDLQTGANQAGGAKFRNQLIGNPQQRLNLREAVEALPNGQERWRGFNNLLEVLEATGTRQGIGTRTAYNAQINSNTGMGGLVSDTMKTGANPTRIGQNFVDRYERYKLGKDLGDLARILTDPNSAGMLREIARIPPRSERAANLAVKLITYGSASQRNSVQNTNQ